MSNDETSAAASEQAAAEVEQTLGERLRIAREAQPLSLAQISAELRIEPQLLSALEEDRLDAFAAPVYAKGYLKQYGGLLGLDVRDLLAQYYRQVDMRDVPVVKHRPIRLRDENQIRHWIAAATVLALLSIGFAIWWTTQPSAVPVIETPVVPVEPQIESVSEPSQPVIEAAAAPIAVTDQPTAPAIVNPPPAPAQPAPSNQVLVELSFAEDCWTEISDARGERLFYGLGSAGARSRFSASLPLSIFLGNAGGVELRVDGDQYPIPAGSRQGNLARFVIADLGD